MINDLMCSLLKSTLALLSHRAGGSSLYDQCWQSTGLYYLIVHTYAVVSLLVAMHSLHRPPLVMQQAKDYAATAMDAVNCPFTKGHLS